MSKDKVGVNGGFEPAGRAWASVSDRAKPPWDFVTTAATIGVVAAGAALFEIALIPGIAIGGAVVLAPKYVPKYLPKLRRRLQPLVNSPLRRPAEVVSPSPGRPYVKAPVAAPAAFAINEGGGQDHQLFRSSSRPWISP